MYKLKEGMNLPKEFKIKVNPEQSEALQLYLFSIGVSWLLGQKTVEFVECPYLFIGSKTENKITYEDKDKKGFDDHRLQRIKFKDYFEKVTNQFPEKWCIEVNEGNCNELNIWMHRNWKNYNEYEDKWAVRLKQGEKMYFYSNSVTRLNVHSIDYCIKGYILITTKQFREKFGTLKINETEIKAIEHNLYFWRGGVNYYKQRRKDLTLERYEMLKEIKSLKIKIEAIKELISDNPIIKD